MKSPTPVADAFRAIVIIAFCFFTIRFLVQRSNTPSSEISRWQMEANLAEMQKIVPGSLLEFANGQVVLVIVPIHNGYYIHTVAGREYVTTNNLVLMIRRCVNEKEPGGLGIDANENYRWYSARFVRQFIPPSASVTNLVMEK